MYQLSSSYALENSPLQTLHDPLFAEKQVTVKVKRDDLLVLDEEMALCGNKWRKLKYNIHFFYREKYRQIVTFGGAFSNHIAATASAGKLLGIPTHAIIRGELIWPLNPTLEFAETCGMLFWPVSRRAYKNKSEAGFVESIIPDIYGHYIIPEGGTNALALQGAKELPTEISQQNECQPPDYMLTCCGTGGTLAGIIQGKAPSTSAIGIAVLKGGFLEADIRNLLDCSGAQKVDKWLINNDYHFGGYAKFNSSLIQFMNDFKIKHQFALDPIYTGKLFYGAFDLISKGFFPKKSTIVIIHSGGLQGIAGFNQRFGQLLL